MSLRTWSIEHGGGHTGGPRSGYGDVSRETTAGLPGANVVNMTYQITVTVTGGELTVTKSGDVPEGKHLVSGHEDATSVNIGVYRTDADGKSILSATATRPKES